MESVVIESFIKRISAKKSDSGEIFFFDWNWYLCVWSSKSTWFCYLRHFWISRCKDLRYVSVEINFLFSFLYSSLCTYVAISSILRVWSFPSIFSSIILIFTLPFGFVRANQKTFGSRTIVSHRWNIFVWDFVCIVPFWRK